MAQTKQGQGIENGNSTDYGDTPFISEDIRQSLAGTTVTYDRTLVIPDNREPAPEVSADDQDA